jgi:phosphoribosyl 1,2-cyclic phosphodiesterase/CheY-like chemotaxis protein
MAKTGEGGETMRFLVVDDSESIVQLVKALLESGGHDVVVRKSSVQALEDAVAIAPEVILLDLMMPEMDGFELCRRLREKPELAAVKIVVLSGKSYDFDKRRARQMGADGYIVKPIRPDTFLSELQSHIAKSAVLTYWGTRGTLPVPGPDSLRYGGNTSCLTLEAAGEPLLIFDAGSGIKRLANHLMAQRKGRLTAKILITHPHWDHINALPFFTPLYLQGNEIEILGSPQGDASTFKIMSAQMDDVYFPVTIREFGARVFFRDLREESIEVGGFKVSTMLLSHPGNCLGYRAEYQGHSVCYITDNELFLEGSDFYNPEYNERLADFVRGTDILIADTTYTDQEYRGKVGWGHSCVSEVVALAHAAQVKSLHLFHHDPDQNDEAIDRKCAQAQERIAALESPVECLCPVEGASFTL